MIHIVSKHSINLVSVEVLYKVLIILINNQQV